MNFKINKFFFLLLLSAVVLSFAVNASANNKEPSLEDLLDVGLEELQNIVVSSASKVPQKTNNAPAVIRVITAEQIKERGYVSLEDALSDLPGFQFRNIQGFNSYTFLRGAPSQNNLILVLVDGIEINELNSGGFYGGLHHNLENVKRIEVVSGPVSTLYGTNAVSGVINIITRDPDDEDAQGAWASGTVGSFDTGFMDFRVGKFFKEYDFGFSFSGMYKTTEKANLKGVSGDSNWTDDMENFEEDLSFDGKLKYKNFDFGFVFQNKEASRTTNYKTINSNKLDRDTRLKIRFMNFWLKHDYGLLDNLRLKSTLYYRDATILDDTVAYIDKAQGSDPGSQIGYYRPNNQTGVEEQFTFAPIDSLNIIAGVVFEKETLSEGFSKTFSASQDEKPARPEEPPKIHSDLISFYLQTQYKIIQNLELTAGLRWDDSTDYDAVVNPRTGLVYNNKKWTAKLLYSEAYRAPKPWDFTFGAGNPELEPEKMKSLEGFLGYTLTKNIMLDMDVYKNKISGKLTLDSVANQWINSGELKTNGFETTLHYSKGGVSSYLNYTFNESKNENGAAIPEIARHTFNTGAAWSANDHFKLNLRGNYLGKRKNTKTVAATGSDFIGDAFVIHGGIMYLNFHGLDFHFFIKNILNTEYYHTSNRPPDRYRQSQRTFLFKTQYKF